MEAQDLDPPDARVVILGWVIVALLAAGFGACMAKGANRPDDPRLGESRIAGFGEIAFSMQAAGAEITPTQQCALLAATEQQRARGLMTVTDLKGYAGMVFRYSADSAGGYYMKNTPMPLSIAWFAADGSFVSSTDMAPCGDRSDCPIYSASGPYRYALEVPQGQLASLGVGPGSVLQLTGECPST